MKTLYFGIEMEMTGITRNRAASLMARFFGTESRHEGGAYDTYTAKDDRGRKWKAMNDSSLIPQKKVNGEIMDASTNYRTEVVSPILSYEDIPKLQELVRTLRKAGAFANKSCGIHIHVGTERFTAKTLRNLVNIMASKEDMIYRALQINPSREHRYCRTMKNTPSGAGCSGWGSSATNSRPAGSTSSNTSQAIPHGATPPLEGDSLTGSFGCPWGGRRAFPSERMIVMNERFYIAYGSNMSEVQMAQRCPDAALIGTGKIQGYELLFKGSLTGCYATIEEKDDAFVPVVIWRISAADERRLDAYEGFPRFYYKKDVEVETDDGTIRGLVYIMHENRQFGIPEDWYYQNMERDYHKFGFDLSILRDGLRHSRERMKGTRVRLVSMDDVQAPPAGTEGTIQYVDDAGTIHVQWDTGGSLGLVPGADEWELVE